VSYDECLFLSNSYLKEFNATVERSGPRFIVLDRTAFYPESGGQPSDTGVLLHNQETIRVFKVLRRGSDIFHYIERDLPVGAFVSGAVDWDARFLNMRRHSAEHLLSGLFKRVLAGSKVYSDLQRLEYKPSDLTIEDVDRVEKWFNEAVTADVPVRIYYTNRDELNVTGDERRREFLAKIPRDIQRLRMVEFPGYDLNFCFGTHVRSTGEIGRLVRLNLKEGKRRRKIVYFRL
jgi:Ser-tRNA(Ala) deacylase AlaX